MINFNIDFLLTRRESSPLYVDVMIEIVVSSKSLEVMQYHAATLAEQSIKSQLPFPFRQHARVQMINVKSVAHNNFSIFVSWFFFATPTLAPLWVQLHRGIFHEQTNYQTSS